MNRIVLEKVGDFMAFNQISAKEVEGCVGDTNYLIIDVRDKEDFESGHIPTAINIPHDHFEDQKVQISINKKIILYCDRGNLSLYVARMLNDQGYDVRNLCCGIKAYRGKLEK